MDEFVCDLENFDVVLDELILKPFDERVQKAMADGIDDTIKEVRRDTRATVPKDHGTWAALGFPDRSQARGDALARSFSYRTEGTGAHHKATWYAKPPEHRLVHLIEKGHEHFLFGKPTGKRARGWGFVKNARDSAELRVIPNIKRRLGVSK